MTLQGLADAAGVSLSYVKALEAGEYQPSRIYARALANALSCDVDDFTHSVTVDV